LPGGKGVLVRGTTPISTTPNLQVVHTGLAPEPGGPFLPAGRLNRGGGRLSFNQECSGKVRSASAPNVG